MFKIEDKERLQKQHSYYKHVSQITRFTYFFNVFESVSHVVLMYFINDSEHVFDLTDPRNDQNAHHVAALKALC